MKTLEKKQNILFNHLTSFISVRHDQSEPKADTVPTIVYKRWWMKVRGVPLMYSFLILFILGSPKETLTTSSCASCLSVHTIVFKPHIINRSHYHLVNHPFHTCHYPSVTNHLLYWPPSTPPCLHSLFLFFTCLPLIHLTSTDFHSSSLWHIPSPVQVPLPAPFSHNSVCKHHRPLNCCLTSPVNLSITATNKNGLSADPQCNPTPTLNPSVTHAHTPPFCLAVFIHALHHPLLCHYWHPFAIPQLISWHSIVCFL